MPRSLRDWDKLARELSSGEDSDANDTLNVMSVKKNAKRVTELLNATMPGLDKSMGGVPGKGMNSTELIADGLRDAIVAASRRSNETSPSSDGRASHESRKTEAVSAPVRSAEPCVGQATCAEAREKKVLEPS